MGKTEVLARSRSAVCQESRRCLSKYGFFLNETTGECTCCYRLQTHTPHSHTRSTGECQGFAEALFPFLQRSRRGVNTNVQLPLQPREKDIHAVTVAPPPAADREQGEVRGGSLTVGSICLLSDCSLLD